VTSVSRFDAMGVNSCKSNSTANSIDSGGI
jgi:hypothetical protein